MCITLPLPPPGIYDLDNVVVVVNRSCDRGLDGCKGCRRQLVEITPRVSEASGKVESLLLSSSKNATILEIYNRRNTEKKFCGIYFTKKRINRRVKKINNYNDGNRQKLNKTND